MMVEIESQFAFILALLILVIGIGVTIWIHYIAIFHVTQWLSPENKVIVITGCDSGIGFFLARHFHQKGSIIIATVVSKNSDGAQQLKAELGEDRFHLVELKFEEGSTSINSLLQIQNILELYNSEIHALINNAGICIFGEFDFLTYQHITDQFTVNLLGLVYTTKALMSNIIQSKGRIINVSSVLAMQPFPGLSVYSATKKAVEGFSESLRFELSKFDVKVVNVRLGDYAKHTQVMARHQKVANEQYQQFDEFKHKLYDGYFHRYHELAVKDAGLFSPSSLEKSNLFDAFDEAVYAVNPRNYILSAIFSYKLIIYFLMLLPLSLKNCLFQKFIYSKLNS